MRKKKIRNVKAISGKKIMAATMAVSMIMGSPFIVNAATEHYNDASLSADSSEWEQWKTDWTTIANDYEKVSINVGADESQLGFAFYQHTTDTPKVRYSKTKEGLKTASAFEGTLTETSVAYSDSLKEELGEEGTYQAADVTITGLKANTKYYYQICQNGKWGKVKIYKTKASDKYSVLYVADPQLGACKGQANSDDADTKLSGSIAARNDSYNWNNILTEELEDNDISFILSAGDQVNTATNEYEYAGFLNPNVMNSVALSTAIGNHDSSNISYTNHYNNPNSFDMNDESQADYTDGHTAAGTDYYYTYGNVLYMILDTNNYNCATHENVIKKAVEANPDCKWRVVMFHQDIYGSGADHSDSDGIILRTQLTPLMDKYDVDVVLQGHDHTYSRSYQLSSDGKEHTSYDAQSSRGVDQTEYAAQNNCYNLCSTDEDGTTLENPEGTVYFEQNSATGSKFYNLSATQQNYISERSQTWTPTYSIMDVSEDSLSITTYDATTGTELDGSSTYTIVKNEKAEEKTDDQDTDDQKTDDQITDDQKTDDQITDDQETDEQKTDEQKTDEQKNITSAKKNNAITVKTTSKKLSAKKLKKSKRSFTISAKSKICSDKLTFKKTAGSKKITVSKNGKVTVAKGTKKGTYKVKIKISSSGNKTYKATSVTKTIKIKVK